MQTPRIFQPIIKKPSKEVDDLARLVIGAAIEVHRILGPGYVENVYEKALCIEFDTQKILFQNQLKINVEYKQKPASQGRLDFLVGKLLPIEIKAVSGLLPIHQAQLIVTTQRSLFISLFCHFEGAPATEKSFFSQERFLAGARNDKMPE